MVCCRACAGVGWGLRHRRFDRRDGRAPSCTACCALVAHRGTMGDVTCAFSATEHRFRKSTADGRRKSRHRHRLLASSSACSTGRCSNSCSNGLRRGNTGAGRPRRSGLAVSGHRRRIRDLKSGSQGQRATRRARLGPQPPRDHRLDSQTGQSPPRRHQRVRDPAAARVQRRIGLGE